MDMTGQPRLWVPAVEAAHMQVHHDGPRGWVMNLAARRQGDAWGEELPDFYSDLGTLELFDTITASWERLLGL